MHSALVLEFDLNYIKKFCTTEVQDCLLDHSLFCILAALLFLLAAQPFHFVWQDPPKADVNFGKAESC